MLNKVKKDLDYIINEWLETDYLKSGNLFVVGCSTSEVAGKHIGTSGSEEIAEVIFHSLNRLVKERDIHLAFQCCEHLNRALVIEKKVLNNLNLDPVSVVPVPTAGGSMASYAFNHFDDAAVVENIAAHAGMDIGDTMIGMHLKTVAVPLRFNQKTIGNAHITSARTRPKLIGGARAHYA